MFSRRYIIGRDQATECPWCDMPVGYHGHAIEIMSENHTDCIKEGFCCHYCAKEWIEDMKEKLIKAVDQWLAGHRPIINNLPIEAHKLLRAGDKHYGYN